VSKHEQQIRDAAKGKVDEEILGAAFAKPRGSNLAAAGGGLITTEIGARQAGKHSKGAEASGIEIANPGGVAVTPTSLLTMELKMSLGGGQVKDITKVLSTVPLAAVDSLKVKRMGLTGWMEITIDGNAFKLEGKAKDMKEFAEAFERAKATA
jgi:hypothetical protein